MTPMAQLCFKDRNRNLVYLPSSCDIRKYFIMYWSKLKEQIKLLFNKVYFYLNKLPGFKISIYYLGIT